MSSPLILRIITFYLTIMVLSFLIYIKFKILFPFFKSGLKNIAGIYAREKTIYTEIVSKRFNAFVNSNGDNIENYYLSFKYNKKVLEFLVDYYYYSFYSKGEKGYLTYKGTEFIEFIRIGKKSI